MHDGLKTLINDRNAIDFVRENLSASEVAKIKGSDNTNKIATIKWLRGLFNGTIDYSTGGSTAGVKGEVSLGLKEAKDLVELITEFPNSFFGYDYIPGKIVITINANVTDHVSLINLGKALEALREAGVTFDYRA